MTILVELPTGDRAEAEALDGEVLTLRSPRPFAPGTPLRLEVSLDTARCTVESKTVGAKRRADGTFEVRLRLVSLRRADRALLAEALSR